MRIVGLIALVALGLSACGPPPPVAASCGPRLFEGAHFTACRFDSRTQQAWLAWRAIDGTALRGFNALSRNVKVDDIAFAINAGMFDAAGSPIGLYVENGQELHAISTTDGPGNFHLKPNGVFWIDAAGDPHVAATDTYLATMPQPKWATQSGPMLVIDGRLHPAISDDGQSRYIRNGVGTGGAHTAWFVISDEPVSFGKLARFFRDALRSENALYLDGSVSSLWAPSLQRMDTAYPLGPLVVVTSPSPSRP